MRLGDVGAPVRRDDPQLRQPDRLDAGYKVNVVPGTASAQVDGRIPAGHRRGVPAPPSTGCWARRSTREFINHEEAPSADPPAPTFAALAGALRAEDPAARPVPYVMAGGTDAKAFHRIGITSFGFAPLRLGPGLDYFGMFHGVDERVPVDGLAFGTRVLDRFLDTR